MTTPTTLLFNASRKLRDAACGYAADLESGTEAEDAAEDRLRRAALDFAAVANATDSHRYNLDPATKDRILGPSPATSEGGAA